MPALTKHDRTFDPSTAKAHGADESRGPPPESREIPYLRAVVEASRVLLDSKFETGLRCALDAVRENTGLDRVYVVEYDHAQQAGFWLGEMCAPGIASVSSVLGPGPYPYAAYEEVFRPLLAGNIYTSATTVRTGANAEHNQAVGTKVDLFVPIFVQNSFWGTIGFDNCTTDRPFSSGEIEVLRGFATAISAAVTRDATERSRLATLQANEAEIRRWLEVSGVCTWSAAISPPVSTDLPVLAQVEAIIAGGVITACNEQGARSMGYGGAADWIGRRAEEFLPRNEANLRYLSRFVYEGYTVREHEANDGASEGFDRWSLNNLRGVVEAGHLVALYGTHRDITQLKRAQLAAQRIERLRAEEAEATNIELRRREGLLHTVTQAARALLAGEDFDAGVNAALKLLGEAVGVDRAGLVADVPAKDPTRMGSYCLTHEWHSAYVPSQMLSASRTGPYPSEEVWRRQQAGETIEVYVDETDEKFKEGHATLRVKAMLAVAVMINRRNWGVIVFDDCHTRRIWARHEISILETAAACVAAAIERREQEKARLAETSRYAQRLMRHSQLQAVVAQGAEELLAAQELAPCLERMLARVGEIARASRVRLLRINWAPADADTLGWQETVHEWAHPNTRSKTAATRQRFAMPRGDYGWARLFERIKDDGWAMARPEESNNPLSSASLGAPDRTWNCCCPIQVEGCIWGFLVFDFEPTANEDAEADIEALKTVAAVIANALLRARDEEQRLAIERTRADEAESLNRLLTGMVKASRELVESEDFDHAVHRWLKTLAESVGADAAMVGEFPSDTNSEHIALGVHIWYRNPQKETGALAIPPTLDFIEWAERLHRGESIMAHRDELRDPESVRFWEGSRTFSDCIVPIRLEKRTAGWVSFEWTKRHALCPAYERLLRAAAEGVAAALKRHEAVRAMAREREARLFGERARADENASLASLLGTVVKSARSLINVGDFESGLVEWLGRLATATGAIRATYYDSFTHGETRLPTMRMLCEWSRPGVEGGIPASFAHPFVIDPRGAEEVLASLAGGRVASLHTEECAEPMRSFLRQQGNAMVLAVPMFAEGRQQGAISFDFAERPTFSPAVEAILQTAADTLSAILTRNEAVANLLAEREARAEDLRCANRAMSNAIAGLASAVNLRDFLGEVLHEAITVSGAQGGAVVLLKEDGLDHLVLIGKEGIMDEATQLALGLNRTPVPSALHQAAVKFRNQDIVSGLDPLGCLSPEPFQNFHRAQGNRSVTLVPMRAGSRMVGWVGLAFARDKVLAKDKSALLRVLGDQMTLAVEMIRLADETREIAVAREQEQAAQRRAKELAAANDALRRSTDSLTTESDLKRFFFALMAEATALSGAKSAGVFTYNEVTERLEMAACMTEGSTADIATEADMTLWREPVPLEITRRWIARIRSENYVWFDNATQAPEHPWPLSQAWHARRGHRYVIDVPLYAGGRLIGLFGQCFTGEEWPKSFDYEQTRILANYAALAMQLARLSAEAREGATREAVLNERNRIARDLHDTLAQGFAGVIMQLGAAEGAMELQRTKEAAGYFARARTLARMSLAEARSSVHALRPETSDGPLLNRLERMVSVMTQGTGLVREVRERGSACELSPAADWCVHKFVQEALANAVKHADARTFTVELVWLPARLVVSVEDDGVGFDFASVRAGLGLLSMHERASEIGATASHESSPGAGTRLRLDLPIHSPSP